MALDSGAHLGPYEILGPLGEGGMGEVYRARDPRFRREVAVKVLPGDFAGDPERLKRFEHEARAAGALNHPNILTVHDLGTSGGAPYLVTELLEGETLRARLSHGTVPLAKALDWASQIARGLAAAHEKGIVHRDLKPENLFITRDGRVKILDFGLARVERPAAGAGGSHADTLTANLTESGMLLGTAGYISPEQVRGESADTRADLFAFGCVLYEMLSGQRAFAGDSVIQRLNAILSEEPPSLAAARPDVPEPIARMVEACLVKDRDRRIQSAHDVTLMLGALAVAPAAVRAPRARFRPLAAGFVAVVILTALVAAWAAVRSRPPAPPTFERVTFRRGYMWSARFAKDGATIVYGASWEGGPARIYTTRVDGRESSPLLLPDARLMGISSGGELAIAIGPGMTFATGPHTTLARVSLSGGAPREVAESVSEADWSPDGKDLAIVRLVGSESQLEFPIGKVLYRTGKNILSPRVSPTGDRVAFMENDSRSDWTRGRVAVVDRAGKVRRLTGVWEAIQGIAWSPHGDEVWYTATHRGTAKALQAVSLAGRERTLLTAPSGLTLHDALPDGRLLVSRDDFRMSTSGLGPGEDRERDLSWLETTAAADLLPDGSRVVFTEWSEAIGGHYVVGMRGTDGSPVVRLGDGYAGGLSPDGRWVVAIVLVPKPHLTLLPIGAGESRDLDPGPVTDFDMSCWSPDGRRVVFNGIEPGHAMRTYVQDVNGGPPRAVGSEGTLGGWHLVSPDGRTIISGLADSSYLVPLDGGSRRLVRWLRPDDNTLRWLPDGHSVLVRSRWPSLPAPIERLDLDTGRRTFVRHLMPADPAGVTAIAQILFTPDLRAYAYSYLRILSDLYVVKGLR